MGLHLVHHGEGLEMTTGLQKSTEETFTTTCCCTCLLPFSESFLNVGCHSICLLLPLNLSPF